MEIVDFVNFAKLLKKAELPDKREFKPTKTRKKCSCPLANPLS